MRTSKYVHLMTRVDDHPSGWGIACVDYQSSRPCWDSGVTRFSEDPNVVTCPQCSLLRDEKNADGSMRVTELS